MIELVISRNQILDNLCRQIDSFFSCSNDERMLLNEYMDKALGRVEICFQCIDNKYFKNELGGGEI